MQQKATPGQVSRPNMKQSSAERAMNSDPKHSNKKGLLIGNNKKNSENTIERETTQASNNNRFSSAHRNTSGEVKRLGSERDSSGERQMKLQISNKFISSE